MQWFDFVRPVTKNKTKQKPNQTKPNQTKTKQKKNTWSTKISKEVYGDACSSLIL